MRQAAPLQYVREVDWNAVAAWALGFGFVVYLSFKGGGFDPLVHGQAGIAVWWVVLLGVAVGALPRSRFRPLAWCALGLLAAFAAWTALSLAWTESPDRTWAEAARVLAYLGVFVLALMLRGEGWTRRVTAALAAAIAFVALVALLSRLHPAWFPSADETGTFLTASRERLTYPLNYWNALGALIAIGAPLVLQQAACARSVAARALAAAALPAMALAAFLTLSRGGIAAAFVALAVYLLLAADRLPKLLTALVAGAGGAILIAATAQRDALQDGLTGAVARSQGDEMLVLTLVVCVVVGLIGAGLALLERKDVRPGWTRLSVPRARAATLAGLLAVLVMAVALDAPGRASDAWGEFKGDGGPGTGTERLGSVAGENRYEFWSAAVDQAESEPLTGTGAGTFEYWWTRNGATTDTVRDAHSLYMQTLGELGIVGFALLCAFFATILVGAGLALREGSDERSHVAAALAGVVAFCFTAAFDWIWQNPVLPVVLLLLASILVARGQRSVRGAGRGAGMRLGFAAAAIVAIVAIAIPLASTTLLRQSEADARGGDLEAALAAARGAQNVQPGTAAPRLQEALVLEAQGRLAPAAATARAAAEREPTNWRNWLVLSRLEARLGRVDAALRDYREAESLNPHFLLFSR